MKVSYELKQGYIDIWNEESEEWDRYIKVNKKSVVEEDKKIEKLNKDRYAGTDLDITADMFDKINELIDKVNSLEKKQ